MKIANTSLTATELVKTALAKAAKFADYNIFNSLNADAALKKAAAIDARIANGESVGRLAGVPYALKDNFLSPAGSTTASSKILTNFTSPITSTAVKLLEAEDAIMLGRTNLDSFAHGSSTENSYFGVTKNAVDSTRVAGGSSGGSAVAVALDIVQFATGTDTGGSIRQPACFNGVYGIKPTYGATSRYGVVPMASSLDTIGFFAQDAEDLDLLMQITAHHDEKESTSIPSFYHTSLDLSSRQANAQKTIGLVREFDSTALAPEIRESLKNTVTKLKSAGHKIVELSIPELEYALAAYYVIAPAELASNLARHDGIRYGYRAGVTPEADVAPRAPENTATSEYSAPASLEELYTSTRTSGFMLENRRRIMIGNYFLFGGGYEEYFLKAAKVRTLIINAYQRAFAQCDFLLTPVSPNPAFKIGEKTTDPVAMYLEDMMSTSANLAGLPAVAFPVGTTAQGLPLGLQLVGEPRSDAGLLAFVAATFSKNSDSNNSHQNTPALTKPAQGAAVC